ncbi:MBL fold metallo-hydrolase [Clostridiaceae bacterium HSG29]|nr:MBL fold metallo-hydrolase [Clostridiaceae bacterium HSG29]
MKLKVLIDNNTLIDRYFIGEPGVSYYIEEEGKKILFDVGYSDAFIKNANKMEIELTNLDYLIISHGHLDHTWGLMPLFYLYTERVFENQNYNKPKLVAHTETFYSKTFDGDEIGSLIDEKKLKNHFSIELSNKPVWITENLVFLGEIERTNDFENQFPIGKFHNNGITKDDYLLDDSALAYKTEEGIVIITGCSHAGICNIIEHAKKICNDDRIIDVIGGFHLLEPEEEVITKTVNYFDSQNIKEIHACHCTDLDSKIKLSKVVKLKEVGVGLEIEY